VCVSQCNALRAHAVFEQIEWIESERDIEKALEGIQARGEILKDVAECLEEPSVLELFVKKEEAVELWREKAFELLIDNKWISGVFDRVVLVRDGEGGKVIGADIIDYKTSKVEGEEEIAAEAAYYRSQMDVYQQALTKLTGLSETKIHCLLVFTQPKVVWVFDN